MDEFDELTADLQEDEDEQDQNDTDAEEGADGSEESNEGAAEDGGTKRVNDLMSKWQKAEARNKKLEERLAALEAKGSTDTDVDPQQWVQVMRQTARDQIYASEPRLARYGIEPEAIEGDSPASMQASLTNLRNLIDRIETDASNRTLKKAGLTANAKGSAAQRGPEIPDSDEDFERLVAQAKGMI